MIILDTNVLSELLRPQPDAAVVRWVAGLRPAAVFTTSVSEAEIRYGVARLPASQRRETLNFAINGMFVEDFAGRVLSFDSEAAVAYVDIVSLGEQAGRPVSQFDAQIAAIARSRGADLATRNVRDFEGCGIAMVNPWGR